VRVARVGGKVAFNPTFDKVFVFVEEEYFLSLVETMMGTENQLEEAVKERRREKIGQLKERDALAENEFFGKRKRGEGLDNISFHDEDN